MATVGSLVVKIGADVSGLERGLTTAQDRLRAAGSQMRNIGTGLTMGLSAPIAAVAGGALKMAADFERSAAQTQAALGATEAQMSRLEQQAMDLGASSAFSANEVVAGQLEMAKAGMTVEQIYASMEGVVNLAAAANFDLATAGETVANTLNMYGMEASKANAVADMFAATANGSTAGITDLTQALNMSGAVMSSYNVDLDDTLTMLGLLANQGLKGSDAGTSLKTMFMRLAAPTQKATNLMDELGIAVYDNEGAMRSAVDIIGQFEKATASMTEAKRNATLTEIFGADAIRAVNMLLAAGVDDYEAMNKVVLEQGAAADMANAQMEGLGGAIEYFSGTMDSFLLGQALPFTDSLGGMIRQAADLVTKIASLPPAVQRFGAVLVGLVAVIGPALILLGAMASGLALLATPAGLVVAGLVALAAAVAANWGTIQSATETAIAAIEPLLITFLGWIDAARQGDWGPLVQGLQSAAGAVKEMASAKLAKINFAGLLDLTGLANVLDLTPYVSVDLRAKLVEELGKTRTIEIGDWFSGTLDPKQLIGKISVADLFSGSVALGPAGRIAVRLNDADFVFDLGAVTATITAELAALEAEIGAAFATGGWSGLGALARTKVDEIGAEIGGALDVLKTNTLLGLALGGGWLRQQVSEAFTTAESFVDVGAVTDWIGRNVAAIQDIFAGWFGEDNVLTRTVERVQGTLATIRTNMQGFGTAGAAERFGAVVDSVLSVLGTVGAVKFDVLQTAVDALADVGTSLMILGTVGVGKIDAGIVQKLIGGWFDGLAAQMAVVLNTENMDSLGGAAGQLVGAVVTKLGEVMGSDNFGEQVGGAVGRAATAIADGAMAFTEAFTDSLATTDWTQFGSELRGFIGGFVAALGSEIKNWVWEQTIFNPTTRQKAMQPENFWADSKWIGKILWPLTQGLTGTDMETLTGGMNAAGSSANGLAESLSRADGAAAANAAAATAAAAEQNAAATALNQANQSLLTMPVEQFPGYNELFLGQPQKLPVTAQITAIEPITSTLEAWKMPVVAEATALDTSRLTDSQRTVETAMTQQQTAESSAANTILTAAETLNAFNFQWPELPEWVWPRLPDFNWPPLPNWSWPSIPRPGWLNDLEVPRPGWLGELLTWSPVVQVRLAGAPAGLPANALGTRNFGGGLSLVGENGPELVGLPAGASVFSANETRALLAQDNGGGEIHVHLDGVKIEHDLDLESLAYELAARMRRHMRSRG